MSKKNFKDTIKDINFELQKYFALFEKRHFLYTLSNDLEDLVKEIRDNHTESNEESYSISTGINELLQNNIIDENLYNSISNFLDLADFHNNSNNENHSNDEKFNMIVSTGLNIMYLLSLIDEKLNIDKGILRYYGLN